MSNFNLTAGRRFEEEISGHELFKELDLCFDFYDSLSDSVLGFVTRTRSYLGNLDSCFFESFAGTIEAIKVVLLAGRIADAYTLLRRFFETTWLHVYVMIQLEQPLNMEDGDGHVSIQSSDQFLEFLEQIAKKDFYIGEIELWLKGAESLPQMRDLTPKITNAAAVENINKLFDPTHRQKVSNRCNDYVHLNFFRNLLVNNASDHFESPTPSLDQFTEDFRWIFTRHIAYVFGIRQEYMASSDYVDALDLGKEPEYGSQYWVAPIVQEVFNLVITPHRPDVTQYIKESTSMELQ